MTRSNGHLLLKANVTDMAMQCSGHGLFAMVREHDGWSHRGKGVALCQCSSHDRIAHSDIAGCSQINVIPNADVTTTNSRNPVPADSGMEGGVVSPKDAAVKVGILFGLDLHAAGIGIGDNEYLQLVARRLEIGCDVKFTALEGTLDAS